MVTKKFYPEFELATNGTFMVNLGEPRRLADITKIALKVGPAPLGSPKAADHVGQVWLPRRIELFSTPRRCSTSSFGARSSSLTRH